MVKFTRRFAAMVSCIASAVTFFDLYMCLPTHIWGYDKCCGFSANVDVIQAFSAFKTKHLNKKPSQFVGSFTVSLSIDKHALSKTTKSICMLLVMKHHQDHKHVLSNIYCHDVLWLVPCILFVVLTIYMHAVSHNT